MYNSFIELYNNRRQNNVINKVCKCVNADTSHCNIFAAGKNIHNTTTPIGGGGGGGGGGDIYSEAMK